MKRLLTNQFHVVCCNYSSFRALPQPRPVYALSNRILTYVSPLSHPDPVPSATPGQAHTSVPIAAPDAPLKFGLGMSQANLSNAAVKIGGSVLLRAPVHHKRSQSGSSSGPAANALGMLFSKSAPAGPASPHEYQTAADPRRRSLRVSLPVEGIGLRGFDCQATLTPGSLHPPLTSPVALAAGWLTEAVVYLHPLLTSSSAQPDPLPPLSFPAPQALIALKFLPHGTSLALCPKDGHGIRVLQLRPGPPTLRQPPLERTLQDLRSRASKDGASQHQLR
ncbi:hypothetical protein GSI_09935 [Ganoderma sinense ZZ0214-1]|uniref:Uncharacterized protein n=1 Tax=Ganoderma sinense ZZ0214-1 TaxID=1077348 RepID=A0A2G8S2K8_9APHY|nr:hypothetical protein GSI_09935 [Ganoderma sinense ZZ0214-1]